MRNACLACGDDTKSLADIQYTMIEGLQPHGTRLSSFSSHNGVLCAMLVNISIYLYMTVGNLLLLMIYRKYHYQSMGYLNLRTPGMYVIGIWLGVMPNKNKCVNIAYIVMNLLSWLYFYAYRKSFLKHSPCPVSTDGVLTAHRQLKWCTDWTSTVKMVY